MPWHSGQVRNHITITKGLNRVGILATQLVKFFASPQLKECKNPTSAPPPSATFKQTLGVIACLYLPFQKNSPYIEEVSNQLYYLVQMGFFERWKAESLGNATMCDTLSKKLDSKQDTLTVLSISHVGSTFALAAIGLLAAAVIFICEFGLKRMC